MQKYLIFAVLALFLCSAKAQAQDVQPEQQALVQKVDSLEMELSYLKISSDFENLNSGIEKLTDQIHIQLIDLKLDILRNNYNSKIGNFYQVLYEQYSNKKQSLISRSQSILELYIVMKLALNFSQPKLNALSAAHEYTDACFNSLNTYLDYYKSLLDLYKEHL